MTGKPCICRARAGAGYHAENHLEEESRPPASCKDGVS